MGSLSVWHWLILLLIVWWLWRARNRASTNAAPAAPAAPTPAGSSVVEVVGESSYQAALAAIAGPKGEKGKQYLCEAELRLEDHNPVDSNAVAVYIEGRQVGYLSRANAIRYRKANSGSCTVSAVVVGGWKSARSEGHYGVQLLSVPGL